MSNLPAPLFGAVDSDRVPCIVLFYLDCNYGYIEYSFEEVLIKEDKIFDQDTNGIFRHFFTHGSEKVIGLHVNSLLLLKENLILQMHVKILRSAKHFRLMR